MKTGKNLFLTIVTALIVGSTVCFVIADEEGKKGERGDRGDRGEGRKGGPDSKALEIFKKVDGNDDGKIGPRELADSRMFEDADRQEVAAVFGRWDQNGDGSIGPKEFKEGMEKRRHAMKGKGKGKGDGDGKGKGGKGKGDGDGKGKGGKGEGDTPEGV